MGSQIGYKHYCKYVLAGICSVGVLISCSEAPPPAAPDAIRPAKLIEIASSTNVIEASFPAIIEASSSVNLTFQVGGLLQEIAVREGDEVSKGQVIARLDQRNFRNDLATAQAQFTTAQSEFERAERLAAQDAIAANVVEQRQAQRDVARAALDSARKALEDTVLRSPFDGVIATKHASNFQNIAAQSDVVTLQTTGSAEAVVQIPATLVANSGRVQEIETMIVLDSSPSDRLTAELFSASAQADPQTQTFEVKFAFDPPEGLLVLPGMSCTVQSRLAVTGENGTTDRIAIPLSAILAEGDKQFVWIVDETDMTVSRREISVGAGVGELLTVSDGLAPGDVIVGAGATYLHEGLQVRRFEQ